MTFKKISIAFSIGTFAIYALLIVSLFYFFRGETLWQTLLSERTLFSIRLSIITATISTLLSVVIAIPSAFALSRYDFPGKRAVDTILELPMIVSPAALGAMLLIFFNNPARVVDTGPRSSIRLHLLRHNSGAIFYRVRSYHKTYKSSYG